MKTRKVRLQGIKRAKQKPQLDDKQQAHPRYGMIKIEYARINAQALVLGWSCNYGFGQVTIRQNYTRTFDNTKTPSDPDWVTFTPAPGIHMDTEAMGPEFVGEVVKAFFWQQESGIPETYDDDAEVS